MIVETTKVMTATELISRLDLDRGELDEMLRRGCPYIQIKATRVFIIDSIVAWLKTQEKGGL